ncbi:unnamed protein product [Caenorhabditis auriculariae]|uniref:Uncharacterized protein n=1 Tax=Caenorhabditis auriculariae TaxID=2777116 RepID=A0A8S1HBG1_9PELO|nr:unnamed protein product [Caenorhabditis auriculariae]
MLFINFWILSLCVITIAYQNQYPQNSPANYPESRSYHDFYDNNYNEPECGSCEDITVGVRGANQSLASADYTTDEHGCRKALFFCANSSLPLNFFAQNKLVAMGVNLQYYAKCSNGKWKTMNAWVQSLPLFRLNLQALHPVFLRRSQD